MKKNLLLGAIGLGLTALVVQAALADDPMTPLSIATHADAAKTAGAQGAGITVGVISVGAGNYTDLLGTGLPGSVTIVGGDPGAAGGSEGVDMMEVVHEMAPKAHIVFCPYETTSLQDCLYQLITVYHADIVVDDIGETGGYLYEEGQFATYWEYIQSLYPAVAMVHSSGNGEGNYYQGVYVPVTETVGGTSVQAQDFGKSVGKVSDPYLTVTLAAGQSAGFSVADNDDPNVTGWEANNGVTAWILSSSGTVLASATNAIGTDPVSHKTTYTPTLSVGYINSGTKSVTVKLALAETVTNNSTALQFKVWAGSNTGNYAPYGVAVNYPTSGSAGAHLGSSASTISVGAIQLMSDGSLRGVMEPFSQTGPFQMNYSFTQTSTLGGTGFTPGLPQGTYTLLSSPQYIKTPLLTAPDGIPMYVLAANGSYANPFGGTSAAAPGVAGALADVMSLGVTKDVALNTLEQTATPVVTGQAKGAWDGQDGYGVVNVYGAMQTLVTLPAASMSAPTSAQSIQTGDSVTFKGSCVVGAPHTISGYSWDFGDGSSSSQQSPSAHKYTKAGTYTANFNCETEQGYWDGTPPTVKVTVTDPPPPPKPPTKPASSGGGGGPFDPLLLLGLLAALYSRGYLRTAGTPGRT